MGCGGPLPAATPWIAVGCGDDMGAGDCGEHRSRSGPHKLCVCGAQPMRCLATPFTLGSAAVAWRAAWVAATHSVARGSLRSAPSDDAQPMRSRGLPGGRAGGGPGRRRGAAGGAPPAGRAARPPGRGGLRRGRGEGAAALGARGRPEPPPSIASSVGAGGFGSVKSRAGRRSGGCSLGSGPRPGVRVVAELASACASRSQADCLAWDLEAQSFLRAVRPKLLPVRSKCA